MKYPFRFTNTYIADIEEIVSAEVTCNQTEIAILFKQGDMETIIFDTAEDCTQRFEDFCKACTDCALQQQLKGK